MPTNCTAYSTKHQDKSCIFLAFDRVTSPFFRNQIVKSWDRIAKAWNQIAFTWDQIYILRDGNAVDSLYEEI